MSGFPSSRRRHRIARLAALPALLAAALLAWLLFWPSPRLLCRLESVDMHPSSPLSGLTLGSLPIAGGLVVTSLRSHGIAERNGVHVGDVVEAVDGRSVNSLAGLRKILKEQSGPIVSVQMRRGMGSYDVTLNRTVQACRDPQDTRD